MWLGQLVDNSLLLFSAIFFLSIIHVFLPFLPIESSLMVLIGYLAGIRHGGLFLIWLALSAGASAGSVIVYLITMSQGVGLLRWRLIRKQVSLEYLKKAEQWFKKYGVFTILGGKFVPGMSLVVLFCCGLFKLPQRQGLPAIFLANVFYYTCMVLLGRYLGVRWSTLEGGPGRLIPWLSLSVLVGFVLFLLLIHPPKRKKS